MRGTLWAVAALALPGAAWAQGASAPGEAGPSGLLWLFGIYVVAVLLAVVEVCLIPGTSVAGLLAVMGLAFCGYQSCLMYGPTNGILMTLLLLVVAGALVYAALKVFARTAAGREFVLDASIKANSAEADHQDPDLWMGRKLTAVTDLRPGGKARYEEQTVEVFSETEFLRAGATVEVVRVDREKLFVREAQRA
jgi:membrane-bound serine protease (ClpP class)